MQKCIQPTFANSSHFCVSCRYRFHKGFHFILNEQPVTRKHVCIDLRPTRTYVRQELTISSLQSTKDTSNYAQIDNQHNTDKCRIRNQNITKLGNEQTNAYLKQPTKLRIYHGNFLVLACFCTYLCSEDNMISNCEHPHNVRLPAKLYRRRACPNRQHTQEYVHLFI